MKGIEDIIRKNREAFDSEGPSAGHFDKFRVRLDELHSETNRNFFRKYNIAVKIAVAVIIFIAVSTMFYSGGFSGLKLFVSDSLASSELPEELKEVINYYNLITDDRIAQIDKVAVSQEESEKVKIMAEAQISDIDENIAELKKELSENPDNQRITDAIVLNQQKKAELMNRILLTMNQKNNLETQKN
jgi:hypothetical protein